MEDNDLDLDALLDETPYQIPPDATSMGVGTPHISDVSILECLLPLMFFSA
jgi:hypothetical protein